MSYQENCDISVTSDMLASYQANISAVVESLKAVTISADNTKLQLTVSDATATLANIDAKMAESRGKINDCINTFKQKETPNPDNKNTSYLMLENTTLLHKDIIMNRIQIIVYTVLIIFFYSVLVNV